MNKDDLPITMEDDPTYDAVKSALVLLAVLLGIFVVGGIAGYLWVSLK